MMAAFLDENLPDGTRLRPGTKFIKYWKMRNTGTVSWNADTKVKDGLQDQHSISSNKSELAGTWFFTRFETGRFFRFGMNVNVRIKKTQL